MQAVSDLVVQGYTLSVNHDDLVIKYTGQGRPDPATVRPLLDELRTHKQDAINFLLQRDTLALTLAGANPDEVAKAREQLHRKGYFLMHSRALGERVAIVEHDHYRQHVHPGIPVYTLAEIRLLQQGIEAGTVQTIADLRLLHTAKRMGVIVK
jgi:hypothetical protein